MKDELCGVCGSIGEMRTGVWCGNVRDRDNYEDLGVVGGDIKLGLQAIAWEGVDWIYLVQDRDKRLTFVNAIMELYGAVGLTNCGTISFSRTVH
jgi:hypothetical protein